MKTEYWHRLEDGRLQCDLCPRLCKLHSGQRGLCYVRGEQAGEVRLLTWGRSSGFCIDPVEKKPFNHFLPGTPVLSFGTAGCNLACKFCQNWDISKSRTQDRLNNLATPDMLASACVQTACRSIAYTYNDPVIFLEYALDVAEACRARAIHNLAVTAGYICEKPRARFFAGMDAANIDLKAFSDRFYKNLCGGRLAPVLDCLEYVRHETSCWLEITTLLIPGENDSPAELHAMTEWIHDRLGPNVPLHFTAFHPDWKLSSHPATPPESLHRARAIAMENGLRYVYTGNIRDRVGGTTFCHRCGDRLIIRNGYNISHWGLGTDGRCLKCQTALPGVFEAQPGDWGNQRVPVHFTDAAP